MLKNTFIYLCVLIISSGWISTIVAASDIKQKNFNADKLEIFNLKAKLTVTVNNQTGMTLKLSGPDELAKAIKMDVVNGTLRLRQQKTKPKTSLSFTTKNHGNDNGYSMVSINGQTVIVKGSGVTVIESLEQETLSLEISVPHGTPLSLYNLKGEVSIGDILAPLVLTTSADVHVGRVTKASVNVSRSGDVSIEQVDEKLDLIASENADIVVHGGDVAHLHVQVRNNGKVEFNGRAMNADLSATDNGDVTIAHVTNTPKISTSRNADVYVQNRK